MDKDIKIDENRLPRPQEQPRNDPSTSLGVGNSNEASKANLASYRYADILKRAGLSDREVKVYEFLLENGQTGIAGILDKVPYNRTNLYDIVYSLRDKGLIEQTIKSGKINFRAKHPNELEEYIEKRYQDLSLTKKELGAVLPSLVSTFNLAYNQPGVKIFEGKESFDYLMKDALGAKEDIYSYVDPASVDKYLDQSLNSRYIKELDQRTVKNLILVEDNSYNRNRYSKLGAKNTLVKYIDQKFPDFSTTMQIYDNKVTYHTLKPEAVIGIVIDDPLIYSLHRSLFKYIWQQAKD